jgi:DNA-binding MarR family transcriptional regulator
MGIVLRIQTLAKMHADQVTDSLRDYDLEWWQYDVLSALRRQGQPYMLPTTELADLVMLTSGAMTNRIDRLERSGLVDRQDDPNDRRRVLVRLTPEGLAIADKAIKARFRTAHRALDGLNDEQRNQLGSLLRNVVIGQNS